jgi:superfamily II DNA or RNA helicase
MWRSAPCRRPPNERPPLSERSREDVLREIALEQERLGELERQRAAADARLKVLRHELAARAAPTIPGQLPLLPVSVAVTPAEKVHLFRRLFRGRADIFPTRFVSRKTGKAGYAPACSNKFVPGVCGLPKIKCGECTQQAFTPVDDQVVLDHLRGRHVIGVYPLLVDDTCWFLAVDFDKGSWKDDVSAFVETCRQLGIPAAVERSRSGNGAHVWFFFGAPVAARTAREMGSYLITATMARRHQISMDSYDRLFPNQDSLPRGGFGNLIALPLQQEARKMGNSVFVDDSLEPHVDQWRYLASVPIIESRTVDVIAREAVQRGQVLGVRRIAPTDDDDAAPWKQPPSYRPPALQLPGPLPTQLKAVLAQRLFIAKEGLTSPLVNAIQRVAAFQNPEFYKKQGMRLSTAMTPRVIACAEDLPQHIALPRGCTSDLQKLIEPAGIALSIEDQRQAGEVLDVEFQGELTPIQERAAQALLKEDFGLFVAPPGVGKTVLGTYLIAKRARSALVLVHRQPLLDQWAAQLSLFLGIDEKDIGRIGGGKRKPNGRLDVAMIQSLVRGGKVDDAVAGYGHVIVDECHHAPAVSFERVLSAVKARYLVGLTATPQRRDGHHPIIEMQLGPIRFAVTAKNQNARAPFSHELIVRETGFRLPAEAGTPTIQEIYGALASDKARNQLVVDDVIRAVHEGRSPVLLTERRDHLEFFAEQLRGFVRHLIVLQGGMGTKQRREVAARLAAIPDSEERLVLATGRYIGEGFDDPRLDTLFLALPVSWRGTLIQYTGRLHRLHPGKEVVRIFDYIDRDVPMLLRMFEKRLRTYRAIGYGRGEAPLGYSETQDEPTIVYDQDAGFGRGNV